MASLLGGRKIAELRLEDFAGLHSEQGDFGEDFPGFQWQSEVSELSGDEIGINGADGMLKLVELTISMGDTDDVYQVRSLVMNNNVLKSSTN